MRLHYIKCNKVFSRDIINKNIKYLKNDVRIFDGYLFCLPALYDSHKIYFINYSLYNYVYRCGSAINTRDVGDYISNNNLYNTLKEILLDKGYFSIELNSLVLLSITLSSLKRIILSNASINKKKVALDEMHHFAYNKNILSIHIEQINDSRNVLYNMFVNKQFSDIVKFATTV